jgi:hypothetical protein
MSGYADEVLADAPLLFFKFDEEYLDTVAVDSSGNGHNGTFLDASGAGHGPFVNGGLHSFGTTQNGPTACTVPTASWMDVGHISAEVWFALDTPPFSKALVSRFGGSGGSWMLWGNGNGNVAVEMRTADGTAYSLEGPSLPWNAHYAAFTFDGSTLALYFDGAQVATASVTTGDLLTCTEPIEVGRYSGDDGTTMNAVWEDLAVYDHALSAERIAAHYAAGLPGVDATISPSTAHAFASGTEDTPPVAAVVYPSSAYAFAEADDPDVESAPEDGAVTIAPSAASAGASGVDVLVTGGYSHDTTRKHRWILRDPYTGEVWEFPHNPNQMSSPNRPRNISIFVDPPYYDPATQARGAIGRVWEGNFQPFEWTFSGRLKTQDQYEQLVYWTRKVTRVQLIDHLGRTWVLRMKELDPDEQKPTPRIAWKYDYEIKATMYGAAA